MANVPIRFFIVTLLALILLFSLAFSNPHKLPPKIKHYVAYQFFPNATPSEKQAMNSLFNTNSSALCRLSPSNLVPLSRSCPAVPICQDRSQLLTSFYHGFREHGYNRPFCYETCRPKWLSQAEICATLSKFESVALLGDSLVRHLHQAFVMLLRNDIYLSSIRNWELSPAQIDECKCEGSFRHHDCKDKIIAAPFGELTSRNESTSCPLDYDLQFHYLLALGSTDPEYSWNWKTPDVARPRGHKRKAILAGTGPWDDFNFTSISQTAREVLMHLLREIEDPKGSAQTTYEINDQTLKKLEKHYEFLWLLPPASGAAKPEKYKERQGNDAILRFYDVMPGWLDQNQIPYLARFNQTIDAWSPDGTHFGYVPNLEQAMVLLNWLSMGSD